MSTTEELAKQAGIDIMQHEWQWSYKWPASLEALEKFRELAAAEERERCAQEAEHWQKISTTPGHACGQYIAEAIRGLTPNPQITGLPGPVNRDVGQ